MNRPSPTASVDVMRVSGPHREAAKDVVAGEEPMEIRLRIPQGDGTFTRSLSVTMRTPGNDFELAAGFLFTEGIISGRPDIEKIEYTPEGKEDQAYNIVTVSLRSGVELDPKKLLRHFYVTSSCGVCGKTSLDAVRVLVPRKLPLETPRISPTSGASAPIGPPSCPLKTLASLSNCSSDALSSMNTPRRQLPSVMTFGVSAIIATVRPLMSVPSTSPLRTLKTNVTRQKS